MTRRIHLVFSVSTYNPFDQQPRVKEFSLSPYFLVRWIIAHDVKSDMSLLFLLIFYFCQATNTSHLRGGVCFPPSLLSKKIVCIYLHSDKNPPVRDRSTCGRMRRNAIVRSEWYVCSLFLFVCPSRWVCEYSKTREKNANVAAINREKKRTHCRRTTETCEW